MSEQTRVLVADDEAGLRRFLARELTERGMSVATASSGEAAIEKASQEDFDVVLMDIRMPGMSGLEALKVIRGALYPPEVIVLTGQSTVDVAVEAMHAGALHFMAKPFHLDALVAHIQKGRERSRILRRAHAFERIQAKGQGRLVGSSAVLERVRDLIARLGKTDTSVVVEGESGTGKELVARGIHAAGPRSSEPFVVVNCGALQETLLESELFGHESGAFTGANRTREGLAETADGGTLFLDEIGELGLPLQAKLLRFCESGEVRRVGADRSHRVNVRVISATNRNLLEEVREGRFREDLYYRLRVFAIETPPLRDRASDVPELVAHFLATIRGVGQPPFSLEPDVLDALRKYPWPGNVRELRNAMERMMLLAEEGRITARCLPPELEAAGGSGAPAADELDLATIERDTIYRALRVCGGRRTEAAKRLGISLRTLYNRLASYSDDVGEEEPS